MFGYSFDIIFIFRKQHAQLIGIRNRPSSVAVVVAVIAAAVAVVLPTKCLVPLPTKRMS
jgi:hypothetical protein